MALFLSSAACLPDRWVASTLTHLCDTKLAPSTIQTWRLTAAKNLSAYDDVVRARLSEAAVVCADETPVRVANEKPRFLHVACNDLFTRFHLAGRDTDSVTGGGVLDKFNGTLVSDCYAPYWSLEVTHQRCVAHLLRDCQRVLDDHDGVTGDPASWAQDGHHPAWMTAHLRDTMGLTSRSDGRILKPLSWTKAHNRLTKLAQDGLDKHPVPDDDRKTPAVTTNARALARRLIEHGHEYLTAGSDEKVPWTNNAAERALRPAKVKQRRSGTYRSLRHAEAAARIAGYLDTARKHELDPHTALVALTGGDPWMPPAS